MKQSPSTLKQSLTSNDSIMSSRVEDPQGSKSSVYTIANPNNLHAQDVLRKMSCSGYQMHLYRQAEAMETPTQKACVSDHVHVD